MIFFEHEGRPESVEIWDQTTSTLRVDTTHILHKKITDVKIELNVGSINVTGVETPKSTLKTSIIISADSKEAAQVELQEREKSFSTTLEKGSLQIDGSKEIDVINYDREKIVVRKNHVFIVLGEEAKKLQVVKSKQLTILERENHVDYIGPGQPIAINPEEDKVTIDRKLVEPGNSDLPHMLEVKREVDLFISDTTGVRDYNLETQVENVDVGGIRGGGNITTFLGNVHVYGFEGEMRIVNPNGNTNLSNSTGSVGVSGGKKEVSADNFVGDLHIDTEKGDILIQQTVFTDNSSLHSDEGTIRVSASNGEDLKIIATTAGELHTPPPDKFAIADEERRNIEANVEKNHVEGYLINPDTPIEVDVQTSIQGAVIPSELDLISGTGKIIISKSE